MPKPGSRQPEDPGSGMNWGCIFALILVFVIWGICLANIHPGFLRP